MIKSLGNSLILRGVLALVVGLTALLWPGITVFALVVLFAVYAFLAAGLEAVTAFSSKTPKPVVAHLLLGLADIAAGAIALAWPGATALVLVLLVASWAVVTGIVEVATAYRRSEYAGTRAMYVLAGVISVAFGIVLFRRPDIGALSLALLFGFANLIAGTAMVIHGIEIRSADSALKSLTEPEKPKAHVAV